MKCGFFFSLKESLSMVLIQIGHVLFLIGLLIAMPFIYLLGVVAAAAYRVVRKIKLLLKQERSNGRD